MAVDRDQIWPLAPENLQTGLPLEGVRVLDLSRVYAGPLAAMVLGDLGADVLKVEQPEGDPVRGFAPPVFEEVATYYLAANRNRRNICLNLKAAKHRTHLATLVTAADVVIDNFLPSQAEALGIDVLKATNPDVVWVCVGAADSAGPLADEPSFDLLAQARSGLMGITGSPESGPMKVGSPIADALAGLYAAIAALAGLLRSSNEPTRGGLRAEAPLLETAISALANQAQGWLAAGEVPTRLGNEHPSICPYAPYATRDGVLLIAAATETTWRRLAGAVGRADLLTDLRFANNAARVEHREALRIELEGALRAKSSDEWAELFATIQVPSAPVYDVAAALAQPQVRAAGLIEEVTLASGTVIPMMASPLRVDGTRLSIRLAPPSKGQHDQEFGVPKGEH